MSNIYFSKRDGSTESNNARNAIAKFVSDGFIENLDKVEEDNIWDRDAELFDQMKYVFGKTKQFGPDGKILFWGEDCDSFVEFLSDTGKKYARIAKINEGYNLILPTKNGSVSAVYKGEINTQSVIYNFMQAVSTTDWFLNSNGMSLADKFNNLSDAQKEELRNIYESELRKQVGIAATNNSSHIQLSSGLAGDSSVELNMIMQDLLDRGYRQDKTDAIVAPYQVTPSSYFEYGFGIPPASIIGETLERIGNFFDDEVYLDNGLLSYTRIGQTKGVDTDYKQYAVSPEQYAAAPSGAKTYIRSKSITAIDTNSEFGKDTKILLDNVYDFIKQNDNKSFLSATKDAAYNSLMINPVTGPSVLVEQWLNSNNSWTNLKLISKDPMMDRHTLKKILDNSKDKIIDNYYNKFKKEMTTEGYENYIKDFVDNYSASIDIVNKIGKGSNEEDWYKMLYILDELGRDINKEKNISYFMQNDYWDSLDRNKLTMGVK